MIVRNVRFVVYRQIGSTPWREKEIVYFYSSKFADRRATIISSKRMCIVTQSVITTAGLFFFFKFLLFR